MLISVCLNKEEHINLSQAVTIEYKAKSLKQTLPFIILHCQFPMLSNNTGEALLGTSKTKTAHVKFADEPNTSQVSMTDEVPRASVNSQNRLSENAANNSQGERHSQKKKKKPEAQFTAILKFFNIILGIMLIAFGVFCYWGFFNSTSEKSEKNKQFMGYILPGYVALSGLIVLSIEMHIKFICRNMKFLYNYFGRGFFNIYVGVMPLTLLDTSDASEQETYFQVAIYIIVSLMILIGLLYIFAKICCCAKEGEKRKKKKRKNGSSSEDSDSSSD